MAAPTKGPPSLPPGYLGPAARFYELGLQTVSHQDPFIRADGAELRIQLSYQPHNPLKMMAQLIYASNNTSEDYSQMVSRVFILKCFHFVCTNEIVVRLDTVRSCLFNFLCRILSFDAERFQLVC